MHYYIYCLYYLFLPGEVILLLPCDPKGGGKSVSGVAHGLVGGELGNSGQLGGQEVGSDLGEELHLGSEGLGLSGGHHEVPHLAGVADGDIRHELHSTGDAHVVHS